MDRILHYLGWLFNTGQWAKWLVHQEVKNVSPLSMSSPFCSGEDRMFAKGFSIHRVWQTTHLYGTQRDLPESKMYKKKSLIIYHFNFQGLSSQKPQPASMFLQNLPSWIFSCDPKHDIFQGSCYLKMSCRSVEVVIVQGFILSFFESAPLSIHVNEREAISLSEHCWGTAKSHNFSVNLIICFIYFLNYLVRAQKSSSVSTSKCKKRQNLFSKWSKALRNETFRRLDALIFQLWLYSM